MENTSRIGQTFISIIARACVVYPLEVVHSVSFFHHKKRLAEVCWTRNSPDAFVLFHDVHAPVYCEIFLDIEEVTDVEIRGTDPRGHTLYILTPLKALVPAGAVPADTTQNL